MACKHVVLVDDYPDLVEVFSDVLRQRGYNVSAFVDAEAALDHLRKHGGETGLVFLDLDMPGIDGIDFLRLRADDPRLWSFQVVILTARYGPLDLKCYDVCAILKKPARLERLLEHVREHCGDPG